jgi:hypothetical protein
MSSKKVRGIAGDKTICLPIEDGIEYEDFVKNPHKYRIYLDKIMKKYLEIFPLEIGIFNNFFENLLSYIDYLDSYF